MPPTSLQWFKTETRDDKTFVFDLLRRRWVVLTPEEEVRQKMLSLLVEHLQVPAGLVAVEYSLKVNGLDKRADAVVFSTDGAPLMIVECKAPSVELTPSVLDQALRYYSAMSYRASGASVSMAVYPKYLLLSNGSAMHCFKAGEQGLQPLDHLPDFLEMTGGKTSK
jgi:type I site-specific restriction-modification system R (restriction) subunit